MSVRAAELPSPDVTEVNRSVSRFANAEIARGASRKKEINTQALSFKPFISQFNICRL